MGPQQLNLQKKKDRKEHKNEKGEQTNNYWNKPFIIENNESYDA